MVLYGEDPYLNRRKIAAGSSVETRQYNVTQTDQQKYISDYFHHVELQGLLPSTIYYYKCSSVVKTYEEYPFDSSRLRFRQLQTQFHHVSSRVFHFTTPPLPAKKEMPFTPVNLALVGDLGQSEHSAHTIRHMKRFLPTAVLHAGDLSYADCVHSRWDSWFDLIEPLSSGVPWHVCPGNHELEIEPNSGSVYTSYRSRFKMPTKSPEIIEKLDERNPARHKLNKTCTPSALLTVYDYGNSFHSTTFGQVRVLFLNSYTSSQPGSRQYRWVHSELRNIDRAKEPWLVVIMHCPFYNTFASHRHEKQEIQMRESLEPLFVRYSVNIVVAGHTHAYSRSKPVAYDTVALDSRAPTYIVVGDGGNREGHDRYYNSVEAEDWVQIRDCTTFGFGLLNVRNQSHAKWQWIKNIDEGRVDVHDEGYILNQIYL